MEVEKTILGQDGFERTYHRIPSFTIFLNDDGTCQMQIVTQNWKDKDAREHNAQALNLQHSIIGLPPGIMKIAYEMLKKYFPEEEDGNDIMEEKNITAGKITAVSQSMDGKLLEKREVENGTEKND